MLTLNYEYKNYNKNLILSQMGNTSSEQLEELLYRAHELGILDELRDRVSNLPTKSTPTNMLERYESCFHQIVQGKLL